MTATAPGALRFLGASWDVTLSPLPHRPPLAVPVFPLPVALALGVAELESPETLVLAGSEGTIGLCDRILSVSMSGKRADTHQRMWTAGAQDKSVKRNGVARATGDHIAG